MELLSLVVFVTLSRVSTASPVCEAGRDYMVDNCTRYRCIFGRPIKDPCPEGLYPSNKVGTGCTWPRDSECTANLETGKCEQDDSFTNMSVSLSLSLSLSLV